MCNEIESNERAVLNPDANPKCKCCGGTGERVDHHFGNSLDGGSTSDCECTWQSETSSVDCGTSHDLAGDTAYELAQRAHDVAVDTATAKRFAEEKSYRDRHGWGSLLTSSQYSMMNRFVDRVMLDSVEMERVRETRKALYATPRGGSR